MSNTISSLEPTALWKNFSDLNAVPRPSKKEERVIKFMQDFGARLGLPTKTDKVGNVLISKPATPGMENRKRVVLQSHLDMVHQKNNDTVFDFDAEGIKMYIDGDWVKAEGTTLGADNGIGVATIMALLESTDIPHPAIEGFFTIDEETGMTGALGLEGGFLESDILLNLDTEDDDELTIGCAGGVNVSGKAFYDEAEMNQNFNSIQLTLNGLSGGHSGMDIIKGLGNANKLMNRFMNELMNCVNFCIIEIEGGGLRNAIPRESNAIIGIAKKDMIVFDEVKAKFIEEVSSEHKVTDPNLSFTTKEIDHRWKGASIESSKKLIKAIYAVPNGIYRMSPSIGGLVQTSNNLSQISMKAGEANIFCLCRSSVDSEKYDEVETISAALSIINAEVSLGANYPGWTPEPSSAIVSLMSDLYVEMFKEKAHVMACHAGLECGLIGTNYPDLDMVSFGPNIRGAHSPDEKVQISSVQKFWDFFLETLKRIPEA
ncbi:MAG: aminoacyl-histidine dipeptidase [Flavobacteriales bacterium]|nr:aminoacyl-histidine dipeptidase [Flavobacteriales bacterium]